MIWGGKYPAGPRASWYNTFQTSYSSSFSSVMISLVETAWTFCMYFNVASNFYYDFLKLLRKLSCENLSLLYLTFIKLLERFIKVLATILSLEVLQVSLSSSYIFESKLGAINFIAKSMQNTFSRIINCKLASCLACYLRSGDHIRWVVEKTKCEYKVIVSVI